MLYSKRVRKKKRLTDPVVIIPFAQQTTTDQAPKAVAPKTASYSSNFIKPEAKVLTVPSGQLNTSNLSIKKVLEPIQQENSVQDSISNKVLPKEKFTLDQAKMAWRRFAHEVKAKGMETYYSAMIKRDPKIRDDVHFMMDVDNQVQIDYITPHVQDLIGYLRSELKNFDITVDFILSENTDDQVKFLTGKDRFASMAKKNPNLHSFKTVFNLDIEF